LPHDLIAAFKSTLAETRDADLLLHVVDASSDESEDRIEDVQRNVDTQTMYWVSNTPVTRDEITYRITVHYKNKLLTGLYEPSHSQPVPPEDWTKERLVKIKVEGDSLYLKAVSGACIEPNGSILLVLDVSTLIERSMSAVPISAAEAAIATGPPPQLSVIVVDDTMMVRELQRSILERGGYAVRTASDGAEAMAMLDAVPADLVVTDVEMPKLDGLQLIKNMRAHSRLANVPVLIVSSHGTDEDRQRGLDAGADGYIVKTSFDEAGLLSAVSRLLGRSGSIAPAARNGARGRSTAPASQPVPVVPAVRS